MKLLNIDANPKTVKGQAHGYMTAVLYLSPYTLGGPNLCPTAEAAGCWRTCLNVQGRGGIPSGQFIYSAGEHVQSVPDNTIQRARLARTAFWHNDRAAFLQQLIAEIDAFQRKAARAGLTPVVRLNGTSDIPWERVPLARLRVGNFAVGYPARYTIFDRFPRLQFYDYTKLPARLGHPDHKRELPANYHLSISWSGANAGYQALAERWARNTGAPLVVVHHKADADQWSQIALRAGCTHVIDGDEHDLRFLEERPHGLVLLKAKGSAKREANGFVLRGDAT